MKEFLFYSVFAYGGWKLRFRKVLQLPFTPFFGMFIMDGKNSEIRLTLNNNEYHRTEISYNYGNELFEIDCLEFWKKPVSEEYVDEILEYYDEAGWERRDNTDINALKSLMLKDYNNSKQKTNKWK